MLKETKVISSLSEFRHLNIGQIRFFMKKNEEYRATEKRQKELNEKFSRKR